MDNNYITKAECTERSGEIKLTNKTLMEKIDSIHTSVIKIEERLDTHITMEEKRLYNIHNWAKYGLSTIGTILIIIFGYFFSETQKHNEALLIQGEQIKQITTDIYETK